ncbi:type III-A CRISPR-associated RAMP protein Csm4 [Acidithiobacillus caldus]|jgi:CRISPR-associated protein Csm4|uniref:CRISPR system Cms protein Csm4 n=1 Tax=Acidithiobacillus caldus TaxID=33059 RepID=A0A1E7YNT8_9PROT|nr:hypothetical protein [Acidithiobacillus caldus]OFC30694.1 hypothetical protein BAE28_13100 [Acidithiobacillus caldus]OFC36782.1 hypothetical protein BAE27_05295 [Acidithiobacillus caldus]OFC37983.1 hypothetical protein BAE29_09525 [Acidithiobacillus caldus]
MERGIFRIRPQTAFGGPLRGDTLFGQMAWAIRHRYGESRLQELLAGYTTGKPFLVCSDGFPAGYLPRPNLPLRTFANDPAVDHKAIKRRTWLPVTALDRPLAEWFDACLDAEALQKATTAALAAVHPQSHNRIDRRSNTTGEGFAPFSHSQWWFQTRQGVEMDLYLLWDSERFSREECRTVLEDVGLFGYGRDATTGLGKFTVGEVLAWNLPQPEQPTSYWTLAPCAPQGLAWEGSRSYYTPFTRFGRHGDMAVLQQPFKSPVLLADSGAVLTPPTWQPAFFTGQGLGGEGTLSWAIPETVQQGYAPVLPLCLPQFASEVA